MSEHINMCPKCGNMDSSNPNCDKCKETKARIRKFKDAFAAKTPNQMSNLTPEQIIELAKKQIGYNRHLELTGKMKADSIMFHWIEGYKYSLTQQQQEQKELLKKCFVAGLNSQYYPWQPKFDEWYKQNNNG